MPHSDPTSPRALPVATLGAVPHVDQLLIIEGPQADDTDRALRLEALARPLQDGRTLAWTCAAAGHGVVGSQRSPEHAAGLLVERLVAAGKLADDPDNTSVRWTTRAPAD